MSATQQPLPVKTLNNGDVVTKIADGTTPSQLLVVNTDGSVNIKQATAANLNATVVQGTTPWVTKDQADGPVTPGTVASFSELIGGQYNTTLPTLTTGQQVAIQLDSSGRIIISPLTSSSSVNVSNLPTTVDTNYGTVGSSTVRTAAEIGNSTGSADFNAGATGTQTLRVVANQGTANATPWNENIAQIAGAVPSATNSLPTQISTSGAFVSSTNPFPVSITSALVGTAVNKYNTTASVVAGATANHIYTITTGKTFYGKKFWASSAGMIRADVQTSPDGSTYTTYWTGFSSTAKPNISIDLNELSISDTGTGSTIRIIITNMEALTAEDVFSTISGTEQ